MRFRRGWMLGDGTGCGKGRQVAAIILDHWLRGRRRALWLSASDKLLEDARRDWAAIGGSEADIIPLGKFRQGADIPQEAGILFATYATLRSPARQGKRSRLEQIVGWLADGMDEDSRHAYGGVIVFDEAHAMANAAGAKGSRGDTSLRRNRAAPDCVCRTPCPMPVSSMSPPPGPPRCRASPMRGASACGAARIRAAKRHFEQRTDFVTAMEAGGVAAMEVVARDLKALGLYQARALSYDGVEVELLEHPLTPEQRRIYDAYAGAFKVIHRNIEDALESHRHRGGRCHPQQECQVRRAVGFRGRQAALLRPSPDRHEMPLADPVRSRPISRPAMPASSSWSPPARLCWTGASPISLSLNGTISPST